MAETHDLYYFHLLTILTQMVKTLADYELFQNKNQQILYQIKPDFIYG